MVEHRFAPADGTDLFARTTLSAVRDGDGRLEYVHVTALDDIDHFKNVNDTLGHEAGGVVVSDAGSTAA